MANPAADFPTAIHTDTDVSAYAGSGNKLGTTAIHHTDLEGKQEEEIKAVQTKVGTGSSTPTLGKALIGNGTGTSHWGGIDEILPSQTGNSGFYLTTNGTASSWASASGGGSTITTASNINTAGIGMYDSLSGTNANFRGVESSDGTLGVSLNSTDHTADFTVNQGNLTVSNLAGTLAIGHGGTGQTTKAPAFNALSPNSALGDTIYHDGTNNVRLAGNTAATRKFLNQTGTGSASAAPGWNALTAGDIPNLTASKITDFSSTAQGYSLDLFAAPAADLSLNTHRITNLADPVGPQDAATKNYADGIAQGLSNKTTAYLATTSALPANAYANGTSGVGATLTATANGALTVDSVAAPSGYEVLVKNEATGANNGLYIVTAPGDASHPYVLTRATNFDTSAKILGGFVFVEAGTVNASAGYAVTNSSAITLGTTAVTFVQFSGAGEITAGNGLSKAGNTLSAVGTANRISVGASVDIDAAYVGQASITTLGTVATGTWQGGAVGTAYGGTGIASPTANSVLLGNGSSALQQVAPGTSGNLLTSNGTTWASSAAAFGKVVYDAVVAASGGDYTTVSAAIAAGKGSIFVRRGTYTETTGGLNGYTLTGRSLTIVGEDRDNTVITLYNGTTGYFETLYPTLVTNITIQCGTSALTNNTDGWVRVNASDATFRDVVIKGGNTAVNGCNLEIGHAGAVYRTMVDHCWLQAPNSGGCLSFGFSNRYTDVVNSRFEGSKGTIVSTQNQDNFYLKFRGNHIVNTGSSYALQLTASGKTMYHLVVADNYIEHNPSSNVAAVYFNAAGDWWSNFIGNTVRCTSTTNGYPMLVSGLNSSTFTGNTFYSTSAGLSANSGLIEFATATGTTFTGNHVFLDTAATAVSFRKGLVLGTVTYGTFTGNTFSNITGTSNYGVNVASGCVEVSLAANVFLNCTSPMVDGSNLARTRMQTELNLAGGIVLNQVTKTANYTLTRSDYAVVCATNAFTVTLPSAATVGAGKEYTISAGASAATNNITIATTSSQTIDGAAPGTLTTAYQKLKVISDGANWFTIN